MRFNLALLSVFFLNGCVSISNLQKIERSDIRSNTGNAENIEFVLKSDLRYKCVRQDQKNFLVNDLLSHLSLSTTDKVRVFVEEKVNVSPIQGLGNILVSLLTYTVIPVYNSLTFDVDVEVISNGKAQYRSFSVNNESLGSVLALPFMVTRSNREVIRNNMEAEFNKVLKQKPQDIGFLSKYINLKSSSDCPDFRDELSGQQW